MGQLKFLLEQNNGMVESCPILSARESYLELWPKLVLNWSKDSRYQSRDWSLIGPWILDTSPGIQVGQLKFLLEQNNGMVESCPILSARESYLELWPNCDDFPQRGLGSREGTQ